MALAGTHRVVLVGNLNVGKTMVFNRLAGLRAQLGSLNRWQRSLIPAV
ncbi:FeoB small GTPase domain-containing protein [Mycobacterium lepromatosis]